MAKKVTVRKPAAKKLDGLSGKKGTAKTKRVKSAALKLSKSATAKNKKAALRAIAASL